jgi:hypothetical protein
VTAVLGTGASPQLGDSGRTGLEPAPTEPERDQQQYDLMHTDLIDPAYDVGPLGSRVRQLRLARTLGDYKATPVRLRFRNSRICVLWA